MNFRKFITMVVVFVALFSGAAFAQQTFYVDNLTGNDANSGTTVGQAKATLNSAMIAAPTGSIISVNNTTVNYIEPSPTITNSYTFQSTNGTPIFNNALNIGNKTPVAITAITATTNATVTAAGHGLINGNTVFIYGTGDAVVDGKYFTVTVVNANTFKINNAAAAAGLAPVTSNFVVRGDVTFSNGSAFEFDGGLNLNVGTITNANNLTIKTNVYRTELASVASGQLVYIGTVNFQYENITNALAASGTTTIQTGLEFPTDATTAVNLFTWPTAGSLTLKLDQNRTINGILFTDQAATLTAAPIDLNGKTLTLYGANTHSVRSNVTGGTLAFTMVGGAANINAAAASATLPTVTATTSTSTVRLLTIGANVSTIGSLTANSGAQIHASNTGAIGDITLNGTGYIYTDNQAGGAAMAGNVTNNSSVIVTGPFPQNGLISLNNAAGAAYGLTSITQSGLGTVTFGGNVTATNVTGNVLLNTSFTLVLAASGPAVNNAGLITFTAVPVTIGGNLTNSASFTGNTDQGNDGNGVIAFGNNTVAVTGTTLNSTSGTATFTGVGGNLTNSGDINFATVNNALTFAAITNSSTLPSAVTSGGRIIVTAGGTGTLNATAILNNSTFAGANISFSANSGANTATSLTESGSTTGGSILLGNGNLSLTGDIVNSRSAAGANIVVGAGATAATTVQCANINNSGSSNITFVSTNNGNVGKVGASGPITSISQTGSGSITFNNAAGASFNALTVTVSNGNLTFNGPTSTYTFSNLSVSGGMLAFGNGTGNVDISKLTINTNGYANLTGGTVDFGTGIRTVTIGTPTIQIGGVGTKVAFTQSTATVLTFAQPLPNVPQTITLGTLDQSFPGSVVVANFAQIPAPTVVFQSAAGSAGNPGNLYILNGTTLTSPVVANALTFNTDPGGQPVTNTVKLDNARLYVGQNNQGPGSGYNGGGFLNETGYVTTNGGFVMMDGGIYGPAPFGGPQVVTGPGAAHSSPAVASPATFGNFGVATNVGGANTVSFGSASIMTGDFYLAAGDVNPANLFFNGPSPYPTIFRTEGTFSAPITVANITGYINVTYYGSDKNTSNEVPTTKLWNLTVATTNGAKPGYGIITMSGNITVNGTLNIYTNQALYTSNKTLTIAGASAIVNGYLVDNGTTLVQLAYASGTQFTGSGILPSIQVNNLSAGNTILGYTGLYSAYFGADGVWGGGDDNTTNANGVITYLAGPDAGSSLTVSFTGVGPHFGNLTMNSANETFTLASDVTSSGNILQTGGTINLGGHMYTHNGLSFATNGTAANGSAITNGTLIFPNAGTTLTVAGAPMTIAANVSFTANGGTITLPAYVAGTTDNLTINGNVVVSSTTGTTVAIGGGNVLKLGGSTVGVGTGSLFSAPAPGTGVLDLYNATAGAGLTFTSPAATTVVNLTIDDNVTLAGSVAGGTGVLTVSTAFIHNAGLFTFGTANLQINGTFTRNGGTYAGDGWLIYNGGAAGFSHSTAVAAGAMTINNLKVTASITLQNARNLNVVKGLWLIGGTITNQVGGTGGGYVVVGDANNVPMVTVDGAWTIAVNALQFGNAANADYTFTGAGVATLSTNVWPTANPSRNVVVNLALATNTVGLGANETINGNLTLTMGTLGWTTPVTVTIASGSIITRTNAGAVTRGTGTFTAPNVNLVYIGGSFAASTPSGSGIEYSDPVVVNNLTLGATGTAASITLNSARTGASAIAGAVTINNAASVLTIGANTECTVAQNITAGTVVVNLATTFTLDGTTLNTLPAVTVILNPTPPPASGLLTCAGPLTITGLASGNITVTGALTLNGGHGITAPNTTAGTITASNNVTVGTGANFHATSVLVFVGTADATLTVPTTGATIGAVTFNKTNNTNVVTLAGGNLTTGGLTTFTNGVFKTGSPVNGVYPFTFTMWVPLGVFAPGANTQGFARFNPVLFPTNVSHVVGNVAKVLSNGGGPGLGGSPEPRQEFPVGSTTTGYHLVAITFNQAFGIPTTPNATLTVSYTDANPGGAVGLPIQDGVATGIDVSKYPAFYWTIMSAPFSIGPTTPFDMELTATGFTGYDDVNNVRIIRRHGAVSDSQNQWWLQGQNSKYDNSDNTGVPTVIVRDANAGLRVGGAVFTLGLKSNMKINPNSGIVKYIGTYKKLWLVRANGAKNFNISDLFIGNAGPLTFVSQSSNVNVGTASAAGSTLTLTPVQTGDFIVTVIGQDIQSNDFIAYSIPVNVGLTDVETTDQLPTEFALFQNYPNPFNPTTNIKFDLPKESNVTLKVYNILGEEVATLVNKVMPAGHQVVTFDASRLASGMYIYRIQAGNFVQVKKMLLMK